MRRIRQDRSKPAWSGRQRQPLIAGSLHGVAQLVAGVSVYYVVAQNMPGADATFLSGLFFFAVATAAVWLANGFVFGAYLLLSNLCLGMHEQEVFSSQAIKRYKSFLRLHVGPEHLTVYPIGLTYPSKRWKAAPKVTASRTLGHVYGPEQFDVKFTSPVSRLFDPVSPLEPHLIHKPIEITGLPRANNDFVADTGPRAAPDERSVE